MVAHDHDTDGSDLNVVQEVIGEPLQIGPTEAPLRQMKPQRIARRLGDGALEFRREIVCQTR